MVGGPKRILFVFAWLVVGGEETELRLLVRNLDPTRFRIDVVACFHKPGMSGQTHEQLSALGVDVDTTPYVLSFDDTVAYLARKIPGYDIVVGCQNVADLYPALELLPLLPPLIEHGGLVSEALAGPKHFTTRYVGVCRSIRDAAASRMADRPHHAVEIPSMVDLSEFDADPRQAMRASLGIAAGVPLIGWMGRLDRKKRVQDFIDAAAIVQAQFPTARFLVIGGPDAFMPDYADELHALAAKRGLGTAITFLGDRADVASLLAALDIFVWLARGEGMPHVIAEAGAAALPVVATQDNGTLQQIAAEKSGLFVPHENPPAVAQAILRLIADPALARRLGNALRGHVEQSYSVAAVIPQWTKLFEDVIAAEGHRSVPHPQVFRSFFQAGFECSTHRRRDGRRLDLVSAVAHDTHCVQDYAALAQLGIRTVRDGLRWHLIENSPGQYDWSSFLPMLRAARQGGTQVIWDLLHYGWPDDIDIWSPQFVNRFARFAGAVARVVRLETNDPAFYCPVNEISFFSWGGGDACYLNPFASGRGFELKVQLARAAIAAMEAILQADPQARFMQADPVINILCESSDPHQRMQAYGHSQAQFQGWDMLAGNMWPQIGGRPQFLDVVGVNYYNNNQWIHGGPPIDDRHPRYKPFRKILAETYARYRRPIVVAETGTEADGRVPWLAYIGEEVRAAMQAGVPVEGICLYPIVNHPGWDDDRHCENGLFDADPTTGERAIYQPLAQEIRRQHALFDRLLSEQGGQVDRRPIPAS
jgi:glycosyltransferase involved in cell wall biosynthesis